MYHYHHLTEFHGLPVREFGGPEADHTEVTDHGAVAWRLSVEPYGATEDFGSRFARFRETVELERTSALIVGQWDKSGVDPSEVLRLLEENRDRLPSLRALFLGEIVAEEQEISWITQSDVTCLLTAFPRLTELRLRGGHGLGLQPVRHESLRHLIIETGGLGGDVVRALGACELTALERLVLWLGEEEYGATVTAEDLAGILAGTRLPALRHLGLRNSEIQNEIAERVAVAPVVARLTTLDLSMGVLDDSGAAALLEGQSLAHLRGIDLSYHYLSEKMAERFATAMAAVGVEADLSEPQDGEECACDVDGAEECDCAEFRYPAVGE
ncbi:STM4015 family protein [Streptomyces sp. SM12]|uniref:STM4015 family protein n=1 Tax=Streptomyces sp. SM12 TaxID=1071602 RepID=UPI0015E178DD|nr:STM4015 family protein [Streptomyces sp. SM12]